MSLAPDNEPSPLEFGLPDRLERALKVGNVTSKAMAVHLGVSRTTVSNYINGRTTPDKSQRRDWAMKTGVPLEYIEEAIIPAGWMPPGGLSRKITNRYIAADEGPRIGWSDHLRAAA